MNLFAIPFIALIEKKIGFLGVCVFYFYKFDFCSVEMKFELSCKICVYPTLNYVVIEFMSNKQDLVSIYVPKLNYYE